MDSLDFFDKAVRLAKDERSPRSDVSAAVLSRISRGSDTALRLTKYFAAATGLAAAAIIIIAVSTWPDSGIPLDELYQEFDLLLL